MSPMRSYRTDEHDMVMKVSYVSIAPDTSTGRLRSLKRTTMKALAQVINQVFCYQACNEAIERHAKEGGRIAEATKRDYIYAESKRRVEWESFTIRNGTSIPPSWKARLTRIEGLVHLIYL